ncbi:MAG: hypothetical protein A3D33_16720 [Candidatus Rokubacteria bacterium RIFCSPHIGHO2_02_FULL_73_26]|nr:MAG: hypothetical protein A3D33_16720 [Candidatus Rokubacteria bacterium RIFCSPHIGHO2_02_FULL_73_26]
MRGLSSAPGGLDAGAGARRLVRGAAPALTGSIARAGCEHCLAARESVELKSLLAEAEREAIRWALRRAGASQAKAAQLLGIPRTTLRDRLAILFNEEPATTLTR